MKSRLFTGALPSCRGLYPTTHRKGAVVLHRNGAVRRPKR